MKVASQSEVAADFAEYLKTAKTSPVVVTSKGKPVAVLFDERESDLNSVVSPTSVTGVMCSSSCRSW